nr:MAG TPA: hypothetical protein [Caudoviricetes sp.]
MRQTRQNTKRNDRRIQRTRINHPHPLQCNSEFAYATLNKKIRMFADYMKAERVKKFVKFINLKPDETDARAETLRELQETCKTHQIASTLEVWTDPNEK